MARDRERKLLRWNMRETDSRPFWDSCSLGEPVLRSDLAGSTPSWSYGPFASPIFYLWLLGGYFAFMSKFCTESDAAGKFLSLLGYPFIFGGCMAIELALSLTELMTPPGL